MRTAIVHYWLLNMRGGEKVVEALCRMLPDADIFTLFYEPDRVSEDIRRHKVTASFLQPLRRHYRSLLPLMPAALENWDLRQYDLVISSESGPAKGILAPAHTRHICYCHTPMRYLWELYPAYRNEWTRSGWKRALMTPLANYLRLWDYCCAARVDEFVANSDNVKRRIARSYRREARVIYPPVSVHSFYHEPEQDYFLAVAELVPYKCLDSAVRVFTKNGRPLRIVGEGPEYKRLRSAAGRNIEFCGRVSDVELQGLYAQCYAFIMPCEEDFGITAVEALASGKPVIALARGGALESVPVSNPLGGVLYPNQHDDALAAAIQTLDRIRPSIQPEQLQQYTTRFSGDRFTNQMRALLCDDQKASEHDRTQTALARHSR